jgi:hypothetical protein
MAKRQAGQDSTGLFAPGTMTVPLRSRRNASPFWIILLLVLAVRVRMQGAMNLSARAWRASACESRSNMVSSAVGPADRKLCRSDLAKQGDAVDCVADLPGQDVRRRIPRIRRPVSGVDGISPIDATGQRVGLRIRAWRGSAKAKTTWAICEPWSITTEYQIELHKLCERLS